MKRSEGRDSFGERGGGLRGVQPADAVPEDRDSPCVRCRLSAEELEVRLRIVRNSMLGVHLDQGHHSGYDRRPRLLIDVLGESHERRAAVAVIDVWYEHVEAVTGEPGRHLGQCGPDPEAVWVHQDSWVWLVVVGVGCDRVGDAVGGLDLDMVDGHGIPFVVGRVDVGDEVRRRTCVSAEVRERAAFGPCRTQKRTGKPFCVWREAGPVITQRV